MAQKTATFLDEANAAMRGCFALVTGNRQASTFFDFSQRGLVGSLIAVLIAVVIGGFSPMLIGAPLPAGAATQSVLVNVVLYAAQAGTAFIALRQMARQDGFLPYLVASNWVTLLSALMLLVSTLLGPAGVVVLVLLVVVAIATFINVGRFIVTLTPLQIGILFLSQAVGVFIALAIVSVIIGPPPGV